MYFEDGVCKKTNLSTITNIIQVSNYLEIHTPSSIYKLRLISALLDVKDKLSTGLTNYQKEGIELIRMPFRPSTDYYCEELAPIDEHKELSNNNPGFPGIEFISAWSQKFGLNEDWLRRIFAGFE